MRAAPVGEVHVWTATTDRAGTDERLRRYLSLLTAEEISRADRFVRPDDRGRFLIARAMARTMLSQYVSIPPADWRFRFETYGKPEVAELPAGAPDLRFNLSHTEGLVACAVTIGREIGIDVEWVRRSLTHLLPERFFSAEEVAD